MSYQVLARKWRPQRFDELIGQEPIVTALQNALRDGRVAQAYLFSGIRGVGKTTAARLLARALNAEEGEDETTGESRDITSSADFDVIEVDAATYSKVEQVRELTESLQYKPAGRRYKVVIIDEIHRLSRQAFDALLKIVEEPPPHLVFIFATTEIEAVPATVLSRCQEFHFRRVPAETLVQHLRTISDAESIEVSDTALRLIARAGEGSVRDSVALLDQLATFGGSAIADQDAVRLLGGLDTALFERLLEAMLAGQAAAVCDIVREIEDHGWDPRSVYAQYLAFCRDALHLALGAEGETIDLPADQVEQLRKMSRQAGYENLLRLLNQLLQSESAVRRSEAGALALEIAWLRAAELPRLVQVERVLASGGAGGGGGKKGRASAAGSGKTGGSKQSAGAGRSKAGAAVEGTGPETSDHGPSSKAGGKVGREAAATTAAASAPSSSHGAPLEEGSAAASSSASASSAPSSRDAPVASPSEVEATGNGEASTAAPSSDAPTDTLIDTLRSVVAAERQPLAAHLDHAELRFDGDTLIIALPENNTLALAALERAGTRDYLDRTLGALAGDAGWRVETSPAPEEPPERESPRSTAAKTTTSPPENGAADATDDPVVEHPTVQAVLDIFGGTVESVEHRPSEASSGDALSSEETS